MRKRTKLQEYLLSAAMVAAPAACLATEPPALQPVSSSTSLRQVPAPKASGVMHAQFAPTDNERPISLTQHQGDSSKDSKEPKKPGFFKRLYNKFTVSKDESSSASVNSGQPGAPIPKPPPIDFTIRNKNGVPANEAELPTQTIGYDGNQVPAYQSANPGVAQPLVPNHQRYREPATSSYTAPSTGPMARRDDFVNPFETTDTAEGDALLDLDSLIGSQHPTAPTTQGAQNTIVSKSEPQQSLLPETDLSVEVDRSPMKVMGARRPVATQKTTSGPFSGYRLPSDDELLGLPDPERQVESAPVITPEQTMPPKVEESNVVRIPLLEEPEMALPTVTEFVEEEELTVLDLAPVERPNQPILIDPEPAVEPAIVLPAEPKIVPPRYIESPAEPSTQTLRALDGRARREQQRYRIMARTGKLGFKGFCPVALRNDRDLVDSRERFKAKFGLQTYYFSSAEAKAAFDANPARYAPAGGGSDVVLLVNTGEEVPGSLDFSLWYRDRLYMFRSRETQAMFSRNPRRFADEY